MKEVLIDVSGNYVGIVISEGLILKILNKELERKFGKPVHMRELSLGQKFSILRVFNSVFSQRDFSKKEIELYSLKVEGKNWWTTLIKTIIKRKINTLYVDYEVQEELKRRVNAYYLRQLDIYPCKEVAQCADIIAYGDSNRKLVKNIWKDLSIVRQSVAG